LALSEFSISRDQLDTHRLPDFPIDTYGIDGNGDMLDEPARSKITQWLYQCGEIVGRKDTLDFMTEEGARQKGLAKYIDSGIKFIEDTDDIFLYIGKESSYWDAPFRLVLKPMSALDIAGKIFESKDMVILMSATIGNPKPLATELGIEEFDSFTYPHPVPKEYRPIYDLGVERMTWENIRRYPELIRTQGLLIARFIKKFDPNWRGIVLTTANYKIDDLRKILSEKLPGRIFMPSKSMRSVNRRISEFLNDNTPGLISVDTIQGWGSGLDLSFDKARMSIIAGTPFMNPSSRYDVLRSERPNGRQYSLWNTFNAIVQASGRVSRGEIVNNDYLLNVSALADGSATTPLAMSQYPKWYKEAITEWL
jgi:Rad3-related DNA helicase